MGSIAEPARLLLTPGEPAGIGPDLVIELAQQAAPHARIAIADPQLLRQRAEVLGLPLQLSAFDASEPTRACAPAELQIVPVALGAPVRPGRLDPANARYVLECLDRAAALLNSGQAAALVTAPVHKGIINDAGIAFIGHTEYLAAAAGVERVVMMLAVPDLRVALLTTHLPLAAVPAAVTGPSLEQTLRILHGELQRRFGIAEPRISVLGLNPHAGEGGHLGREELEVMIPVLARLRAEGLHLVGPLPADTAFTPAALGGIDAVLAIYHDQGLPVLKARGFGSAVNITLGLPWVRTSVDHGTALDLAGSGKADAGSLRAAEALALQLAARAH